MTRKGSTAWGRTQFRVNDDPVIGLHAVEYDRELGQLLWPHYQSCLQKADQILGHFYPELGLTQMDPFRGHIDPGVFYPVCGNRNDWNRSSWVKIIIL